MESLAVAISVVHRMVKNFGDCTGVFIERVDNKCLSFYILLRFITGAKGYQEDLYGPPNLIQHCILIIYRHHIHICGGYLSPDVLSPCLVDITTCRLQGRHGSPLC